MDALRKHLNSIGLGLFVLAAAALRVWPTRKYVAAVLALLGLAALGAYVVLHLSELKKGLKRRSFLYSSNLLLVVVLVLGILVILNVFFARYHKRFDFTETKLHSLSDQSITLVKSLKQDVMVRAFFREGNMSRARMEDLLKIYAYHSPRLKYEFVDPDKNPGLVRRYEIKADGTSIIECGDKDTRITAATEEDLTNAIVKVTRAAAKVIYFLEGHGEKSIEASDEGGYSLAKDDLVKLGYEVKKLPMALPEAFPKDAAALIVPGPEKDLLPAELETIKTYLAGGGRVFVMADPMAAPGLVPFLEGYGFRLGPGLIVDRTSTIMGGDYFMPLATEYEYHEITKSFRYGTFYPLARAVETIEPKPESVQTEQVLAKTSANSWVKRNLALKEKYTVQEIGFDEKTDKAGPVPVAAVATLKPKEAAAAAAGAPAAREGRLAVVGDSDFASNRYANLAGNANFFTNIVNWLTEEADLISIAPKTSNPRTIQMTPGQGRLLFWVSVLLLPLAVLAFGITIWMRRRSL